MRTCFIMVGLPGSGKTTLAKTYAKRYNAEIINGDDYDNLDELISVANNAMARRTLIVDGLFLTNDVQRKLKDGITDTIKFVYFSENRKACLANDRNRGRKTKAAITIKNHKYENPRNLRNRVLVTEVYTKEYDYVDYLINEHDLEQEYQSETWSLGGTYGTCWDTDGPTELAVEDPMDVTDFHEFKKIVTAVCPNIEDRNVIFGRYGHLINVVYDSEADYYGGVEERAFYTVNTYALIAAILTRDFGVTNFDINFVRDNYPELFV